MKLLFQFVYLIFCIQAMAGEAVLDDMINQYRLTLGLPELISEEALNNTASLYVQELLGTGKLSHVDSKGERVLDRYKREGGTAIRVGEILGTSPDLQDLMSFWIASPDHRNLIMDTNWSRIGSALLKNDDQYIAVVLFSDSVIKKIIKRKLSDRVVLSIDPLSGEEISIRGFTAMGSGSVKLDFKAQDLPVLLIVDRKKEEKIRSSDFIYVSDNF